MEDFYDEVNDRFPTCWEVGRALGITDSEMEAAEGMDEGRLQELGL